MTNNSDASHISNWVLQKKKKKKKSMRFKCLLFIKWHCIEQMKGTWDQINNLKRSFCIKKQNSINQKFEKLTYKQHLVCYACPFKTQLYKFLKNGQKHYKIRGFLCKAFFLFKIKKYVKTTKDKMFCSITVMTPFMPNSKLWDFITSRDLIKIPHIFVQGPFSTKLIKICYKNRG